MKILFPAAATSLLIAVAGCQNNGSRGGGNGGAPMTASGELAVRDPKPMDAHATFFSPQLEVETMLAKSDAMWANARPEPEAGRGGGGRGGFSGGLGGGRRGAGGGGGRRGGGEGPMPTDGDAPPRAPAARPSNAPPIQLRLRLTNTGEQPLEVEVLDFNSELGNFAVQPPKITVPPHQSVEADPMTSRLGVPAVEEIPLTVRIRVGGKGGKSEQQILKLRPRAEAAIGASAS